jgi:hypothetical protein
MPTFNEMMARIERLEQLVNHLYASSGVAKPDAAHLAEFLPSSSGPSAEVQELARAGRTMQAIKLHRDQTGKELAVAKAEVEAIV